jgi:hypothetical protein
VAELETKRQYEALTYALEHARVAPEADIFYFSFEDKSSRRYYVAAAAVTDGGPDVNLVFTVASHSRWIFITATDGVAHDVARLLARLEDFVANSEEHVHYSHTLAIDEPFAAKNGRVAMLLLPASVSPLMRDWPDETTLDGQTYHLALVVFLTPAEYRLKRERGYDALLDQFEAEDRDLVTFRAPS